MTLGAVVVASLFGSLHCVGMCGGFVAATSPRGRFGRATFGYHAARLGVYALLGALAGGAGAGVDALGHSVGFERAAALLMGVALVGAALATFARLRAASDSSLVNPERLGPRDASGPGIFSRLRLGLARLAAPGTLRGGASLGAASALLPCGWLWSFLLAAAATGGALEGAAVMGGLWLGSLPALLGAGWVSATLVRRAGRHAPWIAAALVLGLGVWNLAARWPAHAPAEEVAPCHDSPEALP